MGNKKKVTVTKASRKSRKEAGDSAWVSMNDAKSKQVSSKRADRMKKRGWQESRVMGDSPAKKRDKVLVTKTKKSADPNAWTSTEDIKSKRVSEKRAGRMEKRGWQQHHRMGGAATGAISGAAAGAVAEGVAEYSSQLRKNSPAKMSDDLSYGGSVIDQEPGALSHMGASKVLKHMKSRR